MKEEVKNLWVEALRSAKYKQCQKQLKNNDAFCCLGVLCDISGQGEWKDDEYLSNISLLPKEVMEWAEMKSCSGNFKIKKHLTQFNDDLNYTFEEIADVIEENWKLL